MEPAELPADESADMPGMYIGEYLQQQQPAPAAPSSATPGVAIEEYLSQQPPPLTAGRAALGAAEIAGAKIASYPGQMIGAAENLITGRTGEPPLQVQPGQAGQQVQEAMHAGLEKYVREPLRQAIPGAYKADEALQRKQEQFMREHPAVQRASDIAGDVATLAPAGIGAKAAAEWAVGGTEAGLGARSLAEIGTKYKEQGFDTPADAQSAAVGFRNDRTSGKVAWHLASPEGRAELTNQNNDVAQVLARHDAGIPVDQEITDESLAKALKAPQAAYDRTFARVPTAPLSPANQQAVAAAIRDPNAPEVPYVTRNMAPTVRFLNAGPLSRQQLQTTLSQLRKDGFANIVSDSAKEQALGKAQLGVADVLETHIEEQVGPAQAQQFRAARQAIARTMTVRAVRQGKDINFRKLVRLYDKAPAKYKQGALQYAARFAREPENKYYTGDRVSKRTGVSVRGLESSAKAGLTARTLTAVPRMTGLPQRALRRGGQSMEGVEAAKRWFPGRDDSVFAPLPTPTGKGLIDPRTDLGDRFRRATDGYTPPLSDMDSDLN